MTSKSSPSDGALLFFKPSDRVEPRAVYLTQAELDLMGLPLEDLRAEAAARGLELVIKPDEVEP